MRIMALDIGETRVGVAVSDPGERVASPVAVLPASEVLNCAKPFQRALEDWEPELLLCGLPYTMALSLIHISCEVRPSYARHERKLLLRQIALLAKRPDALSEEYPGCSGQKATTL